MSILDARTRSGDMVGRYLFSTCDPASGEPVISSADMAVLLGVPLSELRAEIDRQNTDGTFEVPDTWVRAGQRRVASAEAHGATTIASIVAHLREAS